MKVCICEKPSVAKDIAKVLGAKDIKDGYIEGNGYQVTWTYGHLCELKMPEEYNPAWKRWNYGILPIMPAKFKIKVKNEASIQKQFNTIKNLVEVADEVINCGDAGQEGEVIQRWVLHLCKVTCPVKRLWISSLTEKAIKDGFKNLQDSERYDNLYKAGMTRSVCDWLLGINATRFYTIRNNNGQFGNLQSVGRVQTPTLAMVVEKDREVESFVSNDFYTLSTMVNIKDNECRFFNSTKYTDKKEVDTILKAIKNEDFVITDIKKTDKTEKPPKLFDLTSLQVYCNNVFGYSAEETLGHIQSMYEKKVLTYPRVDTCYLPEHMVSECGTILNQLRNAFEDIKELDTSNLRKRKTVFDSSKVTDHHAIIPTGRLVYDLSNEEGNVFDAVVKRFICVFYPDYEYSETNVVGKAGDIEFKANGRFVYNTGFYDVIGGVPQDVTLPNYEVGDKGPHKPKSEKKSTTPPARFTEATLLRAMETAGKNFDDDIKDAMKENGIGRPSTRASIIEILLKRGYITRDKKKIISTEAGRRLVDSIDFDTLKSARMTGEWECKLRQIERGEYDATEFIDDMKSMVRQIIGK